MGVKQEVENYVWDNWKDKRVARWVVKNLPLLKIGLTHPECPVYTLSLDEGLQQKGEAKGILDFKISPKFVMSGGFEGTRGHIRAIRNMHETQAITGKRDHFIVLMLEPDSYIRNAKNREPLVNIAQREILWKTSGLVDALILLPDSSLVENKGSYFLRLSKLIGRASWCTTLESPAWREIVVRQEAGKVIDLSRVYDDELYVHVSFLDSTKEINQKELRTRIYEDVLERVKIMESPDLLRIVPAEEIAIRTVEDLVEGL